MKNILETTSMKPVLQRLQRYRDNETADSAEQTNMDTNTCQSTGGRHYKDM